MKKQYPYIIFFTHTNKISGGEMSMLELIKGLKNDIKLSAIIPDSGELKEEIEKEGIRVITIKNYSFFKIKRDRINNIIFYIPQFIKVIIEIKKILKKEKPDILWTNSQKAHIIGAFLKLILKIKIVWHFRDIHEGMNRIIINIFSVFIDKIISISNEVKKQFFLKKKISVIYNGIRVPENLKKKIKAPGIKIGCIGQIAEWKGQINFLKVISELENVKGYIIGDVLFGEEKYLEKLKSYIFENRLQDKVVFTGFRKDILNYIYSMDMIVHLPLKPEPFGRILIEAMALGIPVITHDIGAIKEILSGTGIIVEYGDFKGVIKWINILSLDKSKRINIGKEEKKTFYKRYKAEFYIMNILKEIQKILNLT